MDGIAPPFRVSAAPSGTEPRAVVSIWLDPACPACEQFDRAKG